MKCRKTSRSIEKSLVRFLQHGWSLCRLSTKLFRRRRQKWEINSLWIFFFDNYPVEFLSKALIHIGHLSHENLLLLYNVIERRKEIRLCLFLNLINKRQTSMTSKYFSLFQTYLLGKWFAGFFFFSLHLAARSKQCQQFHTQASCNPILQLGLSLETYK